MFVVQVHHFSVEGFYSTEYVTLAAIAKCFITERSTTIRMRPYTIHLLTNPLMNFSIGLRITKMVFVMCGAIRCFSRVVYNSFLFSHHLKIFPSIKPKSPYRLYQKSPAIVRLFSTNPSVSYRQQNMLCNIEHIDFSMRQNEISQPGAIL